MQRLFVGCEDTPHVTIIPVLGYSGKRELPFMKVGPKSADTNAKRSPETGDLSLPVEMVAGARNH